MLSLDVVCEFVMFLALCACWFESGGGFSFFIFETDTFIYEWIWGLNKGLNKCQFQLNGDDFCIMSCTTAHIF